MQNPFSDDHQDVRDKELLAAAQSGNAQAIEQLLARHQPWIFNIAVRMLRGGPQDAEDATQDILIKVLQGLSSFRGESKFSTWLYRIAVNHLLNVKKDKWSAEASICSFSVAAAGLQQVPDFDLPDPSTVPVPIAVLVEEVKMVCTVGTLLCLDGRQRLAFILGEVFGVSDEVGAEILEVKPDNFRQILSRARRDLYEYLRGNCSLVDPERACKCARKTRAYIQGGFVDPQNLKFTENYKRRVREVADERAGGVLEAYMKVARDVYRNHPFYEPAEQVAKLRQVLETISMQAPSPEERVQ